MKMIFFLGKRWGGIIHESSITIIIAIMNAKSWTYRKLKNMVYNNYDLVLKGDKDSSIVLKDYVNICWKTIKGGIATVIAKQDQMVINQLGYNYTAKTCTFDKTEYV